MPCMLPFPGRFDAARAFIEARSPEERASTDETRLILYALEMQATLGPQAKQPGSKSTWSLFGGVKESIEAAKQTTWRSLGDLDKFEAMRLFVKTTEEEHPNWWDQFEASRAPAPTEDAAPDSVTEGDTKKNDSNFEAVDIPPTPPGDLPAGLASALTTGNQWIAVDHTAGSKPRPRYQHATILRGDLLYVVGGNRFGRYYSDTQILDLKTLAWSHPATTGLHPCAGHQLVEWNNQILLVGGHVKVNGLSPLSVKILDDASLKWSELAVKGDVPCIRGGHSATIFGDNLVVFGGEDENRKVLGDLHILNLVTATWTSPGTFGTLPAPRTDHVATAYKGRYLYVFGGGSSTKCYDDLHALDLQTMTWEIPTCKGSPSARAGHAAVLLAGSQWYITGGGDSTCGVPDTALFDIPSKTWSVAYTTSSRHTICYEGLSLTAVQRGEDRVLITFGGYSGRYTNDLNAFRILSPGIATPEADVQGAAKSLQASNAEQIQQALSDNNAEWAARLQAAEEEAATRAREALDLSTQAREQAEQQAADLAERLKTSELVNEDLRAEADQLRARIANLEADLDAMQAKTDGTASAVAEAQGLLQTIQEQLRESEASAAANATKAAAYEAAMEQTSAAETKLFKMEVEFAEAKQRLETMAEMETELQKLRKQLETAREEAAKKGSGLLSGIFS
mmetsp:Transcript_29037/g.55726  ORF Transcript_29037/g.55726 Transcript_29037/m.55726 type:complete len:681 (+) Transcript_29037:245-2287(+)|eukprot:CAMPEP_0114260208 /NCGR_PEP_ID=MMETSP0058-20121206/20344_1 /TAXON_ID=36894 /ORGANISM="Pyramimonas parkeae, CCMP726" /LENGTH=680 /DNA_ID=CAMNT_0001375387 /DNA_START=183 /DNA_END=2225 /DNA_ORIENTATION=+